MGPLRQAPDNLVPRAERRAERTERNESSDAAELLLEAVAPKRDVPRNGSIPPERHQQQRAASLADELLSRLGSRQEDAAPGSPPYEVMAQHLDGISLVPLLMGRKKISRDAIYWHYPHYSNQGGFPGGAVRMGDWKLIERFEDGRVHLYNLKLDVGERKDLTSEHPERVERMREKLHSWYRQVDAKFLRPKDDGQKPWRPQ